MLTAIKKLDLSIHGKDASVIAALIATGAIDNSKISATAEIEDTKLATITAAGKVANSATTATDANVADAIIARDANGGFSAGDVILSALTVNGNLAVNGTTTSVNSVDLVVNDRLVHLNEPAIPGADDPAPTGLAGLSVHRGSEAGVEREHAGLVWDEAAQQFVMQMLAGDAPGSEKLNLEIKSLLGSRVEIQALNAGVTTDIDFSDRTARIDFSSSSDNTYIDIAEDQFSIQRSADNYATYSQFEINADGVKLADGNGDAMLPTLDQHLVVKKYVDDADVLKFDKAGGAIDADGVITLSDAEATASLGASTISLESDHTYVPGATTQAQIVLDGISFVTNHDSGDVETGAIGAGGIYHSVVTSDVNVGFAVQTSGMSFDSQDINAVKRGIVESHADFAALTFSDSLTLATKTEVRVDVTGVTLTDEANEPVLPTDDAHLVVKKYVDDADTEILDKSGIVVGTQNTYSSTAVVADGDSLVTAIGKLDESVAEVAGKSYHEAFIYSATGGETSLAKPVGAPAIPANAFTEVYIDGRKVFMGADKQFEVATGGGSIEFAALDAGQSVELRYFA